MIELKILPRQDRKEYFFFQYYDPIQEKEIYQPVSYERIDRVKVILETRYITEVKLISVLVDVEILI